RAMPRPPSSPTNMPASRSPPPRRCLNADRLAYNTVDHPRSGQCFLNQPAPIRCNLWLCGHACETNSGRPDEVIKYAIAVPAVAAGHASALAPSGRCGLRLWYCSARRPAPNMWRFTQPKGDMDDLGLALDAKRVSTLFEHFQHRRVVRQDLSDQFLESGFPGNRGEMMHEHQAETFPLILIDPGESD